MVRPVLSPEQRQGALAELERVIARLNRALANQFAAIDRLAEGSQPATRMLGLLHTTEERRLPHCPCRGSDRRDDSLASSGGEIPRCADNGAGDRTSSPSGSTPHA
jgi:hypothetical protein